MLLVGVALCAVFAVAGLAAVWRSVRAIGPPPRPAELPRWPTVSIIIPACNEGETLERATAHKLAVDYPNLELILVNDRSTDDTGAIADRLAASDPRVRVVHVTTLPDGWLGKVHALARGVEASRGEWLLFSDADVEFAPQVLEEVVGACVTQELEFATLVPRFLASHGPVDVLLTTFLRHAITGGRLWSVRDARSGAAVGGGLFNLVRRDALERTAGLAWLRLEIADDVALGQMMKFSGARCAIFNGRDAVSLHYYRSLADARSGFEKNGYAVFTNFNFPAHLALVAALVWLEVGSFFGLLSADPLTRALAAVAIAATTLATLVVSVWTRRPLWSACVPWLGGATLAWFSLRSALLAEWRGAILWRGTRYALSALRGGRRLIWRW